MTSLTLDDREFLYDLFITDPTDDKTRIQRSRGGLLRDSYRWIFDRPEFVRWENELNSGLAWIKGDPGKGKTMLLCGIIDELSDRMGSRTVYFFCGAMDNRLNSASAVLRGLLYQSLQQTPSLIGLFQEEYRKQGSQLFRGPDSLEALAQMFTTLLGHERFSSTIILIDALDECEKDLDWLLNFVAEISKSVRVLVTSRNFPNINEVFSKHLGRISIGLELNQASMSAGVEAYICSSVDNLARQKGFNNAVREDIHDHLTSNSNDTYLWVALVIRELRRQEIHPNNVKSLLISFPPGLEALYERFLADIRESENSEMCRKVLAVSSIADHPLHLTELQALVGQERLDIIEAAVEECGGFLSTRDNIVNFAHFSAKQFLVWEAHDKIMPLGIDHEHEVAFSNSLQFMSTTYQRNVQVNESMVAMNEDDALGDGQARSNSTIFSKWSGALFRLLWHRNTYSNV